MIVPTPLQALPVQRYVAHPSCVYFLCRRGEVVYVGESQCLPHRLRRHHKEKTFDEVFWIPVPPKERLSVEQQFISALRPRLNAPYADLHQAWKLACCVVCPPRGWSKQQIGDEAARTAGWFHREVLNRYAAAHPKAPDLTTLPSLLLPDLKALAQLEHSIAAARAAAGAGRGE